MARESMRRAVCIVDQFDAELELPQTVGMLACAVPDVVAPRSGGVRAIEGCRGLWSGSP